MHKPRAQGFTLIEVLLVLVIIGLSLSIAVPVFVDALRSTSLRTSVRAIEGLNKQARALAVLRRVPVTLTYNHEARSVELTIDTARIDTSSDRFFAASGILPGGPEVTTPETSDSPAEEINRNREDYTHHLQRNVTLLRFEGQDGEINPDDGPYVVHYLPSGLCTSHSFVLVDDRGRDDVLSAEVNVDGITGDFSVEYSDDE